MFLFQPSPPIPHSLPPPSPIFASPAPTPVTYLRLLLSLFPQLPGFLPDEPVVEDEDDDDEDEDNDDDKDDEDFEVSVKKLNTRCKEE
ncbi:hypothetical protein QYF36_010865 [Acer negundo]|nr:hypothetical protein QYF36_010865 [Acer negundo]